MNNILGKLCFLAAALNVSELSESSKNGDRSVTMTESCCRRYGLKLKRRNNIDVDAVGCDIK